MSLWRRQAIERMPSLRALIEDPASVWSPMSLWIELRMALERAYAAEASGTECIDEIWNYLHFVLGRRRADTVLEGCYCGFLEHLLADERIALDLPRRMERATFLSLRAPLSYACGEARFTRVLAMFDQARHPTITRDG